MEFGLGLSTKDTYILDWTTMEDHSRVHYEYCIPDGVPTWIRIRATNNGLYKS